MISAWTERLARIEYVLICTLALVLPILESPKNLAVFLLLLVWVAQRIVARDFTFRIPDKLEVSLLGILAVCILSTAVNWPLINGLKGLKDTLVQVFVFWIIYRAGYTERQRLQIVVLVVAGVMVGLAWGVLDVVQGRLTQLQFHSAGIVTQSALYLGISLLVVFAIAWNRPAGLKELRVVNSPVVWWFVLAIMLLALFLMASRGAILAVAVAGLIFAFRIRQRLLWFAILGGAGVALLLAVILPDSFGQSRWLTKTRDTVMTGRLVSADKERVDNWRIAWARVTRGDSLILGIGPRNFAAIDHMKMKFDPPLTIGPGRLNHAHNMYLNKLVEEGFLGLAAMLLFFGIVILGFVRDIHSSQQTSWKWYAGVGALVVPCVAGLFGTPWYQEHALLAMMVLALSLAPSLPKAAGQRNPVPA